MWVSNSVLVQCENINSHCQEKKILSGSFLYLKVENYITHDSAKNLPIRNSHEAQQMT